MRPPVEAYRRALACDPVSAFGGIIAFNRELDGPTAAEIAKLFTEVIVVPAVNDEVFEQIASKKNLRLLVLDRESKPGNGLSVKSVAGGLLVQTRDTVSIRDVELRTVTKREPSPSELKDLLFAFQVAKHVKSNAIVYAKNGATVGIGAGQMSRVDSSRIAVAKAADSLGDNNSQTSPVVGSVVASDAFFPFADGLLAAANAGATAVIQPGGSMRDDEVIKAADEAGLAMVFTGVRHFRH